MTRLNDPRLDRGRVDDAGDTLADPEAQAEIDDVLGALADPATRAILRQVAEQPRSTLEVADRCDLSPSTAYRKVDLLVTAGLLEERIEIDTGGHHATVYSLAVSAVQVSLADGSVTLEPAVPGPE